MLDICAPQGDGAEEIRGGKGNGLHRCRVHRIVFHRYILHCHIIKQSIRPAAQESKGSTAFDANGSTGALAASRRSRIIVLQLFVRVGNLAGFLSRTRSVMLRIGFVRYRGRSTLILRLYIVLFQILGILFGLICPLITLLGPLGPLLGILIFTSTFICCTRCCGLGLGIILKHTGGDGRNGQTASSDAALGITSS